MKVIALQIDIAWEDKPTNFAKVRCLLSESPPEKNSLVVLPEMFATGFSMNTGAMAESYGGETEQFLAAAAKEFGVYVLGGAAMRGRDGQVRNKALVFSPTGDLLAFYAKLRPFAPGGEADHYTAGERPVVFTWGGCKASPFVCYDLRFPELFREVTAAHQPELFVVIANWPEKRIVHWVRLLQARAIENQAYVVGVNRIGRDPYYNYPGRSVIVDFNGDLVADAGAAEGVISAQLDLAGLRRYRQGLPFLADVEKDTGKRLN
ncbi:MAG TPA: nitrilase-related carbon-nitrogen hydrolase [Candidatus Binatia bacterium]|nr:nitrilase-related carbon-nitrogen hydrolase [Candidatus Binatia bacterium]